MRNFAYCKNVLDGRLRRISRHRDERIQQSPTQSDLNIESTAPREPISSPDERRRYQQIVVT